MTQQVRDIMTPEPVTCHRDSPIVDAAAAMRDSAVGDVIVLEDDQVYGILTDRDIAVRVVAEGVDPKQVTVGEVCSTGLVTIAPDEDAERAVDAMRQQAIRRLPVIDGRTPVGIVSIGDLARERDSKSALADISSAPPNN